MLIRHGKPLLDEMFTYRDIRIEDGRITEIMPYDTSVPREGRRCWTYSAASSPRA